MIQSLPYQFELELFTNLCFTLLRNAVQPLILSLSHRNCHAWSYTKTNMHQSAIYRTTNGYIFRIQGSLSRTKYRNNLRKTKHVLAMQNLARWRSLTFVFNNSKWRPAKLCLRLWSISRPQHLIRKLWCTKVKVDTSLLPGMTIFFRSKR